MAGRAGLLELAVMRLLMAIRTPGGQILEPGPPQGIARFLRLVALRAIHLRMLGQQWELGVPVVIEIQQLAAPPRRRMAVHAAFGKLLSMRILVAVDTGLAQPGETRRAQGLAI